jgi:DNA-binding LytR/AlgR family response regulator
MNCLIVDDEPIARQGIAEYVKDIPFLNLKGECEGGLRASAFLKAEKIDLIFLDIQMPKISGLQFLRTLKEPPMAVITTAYPDYALEGYELDVVDYLVKPISFDRFLKAVNKAKDYFDLKNKPNAGNTDYFFVKSNHRYEKIMFNDVLYCEALQNYCIIHLPDKKLITYLTFSGLESQLPQDQFIKVHKSFIVPVSKITGVDGNDLFVGAKAIPISRNLKDEVMKKVIGKRLLKR